jgi:dTDP-4-dehydrorhamnose reductase
MVEKGTDPGRPELWGGIECTLNRVGDRYHNQLAMSGHLDRPQDLEMIASLGVRTLRYPVLWEMVAPQRLDTPDWSWPDQRLSRLCRLGIVPVVGLLHHGSGPSYTSLVDPDFPKKIADYARLVARRYPWLTAFTPINEPLTTARFSALYGHWYPHATDDRAFVRALMQQCRGIVESMIAIREVIPDAQLVVTEDLGKTSSTELLRYQAEFENHRRWLSFDLVAGRVNREHPMRLWLSQNGATDEEFDFLAGAGVSPELLGINYYVTSDRFLDERLELYPPALHGGNHRHRYVDVEAVRACPGGIVGHEELLRSTWERYKREIAITEVHLGSTREEQLRWLQEAWAAGVKLRSEGIPVRAITAWALLGSFNWNTLCTCSDGLYEPGAFDVRGPKPRPTAIAATIRKIIEGGEFDHAAADLPGWWRRPERFLPPCRPLTWRRTICDSSDRGGIIIVGKTGTLGGAFARLCEERGIRYHLLSRSDLDIADPASVAAALECYTPWAVVNAAGFVRIDEAEDDRERCFRENALGPELLASECARRAVALLTFSSDMVFSGRKRSAYVEPDRVSPINVYGKSKAEAERRVLGVYPKALVVRSSAFFGPWDDYNFVTVTRRRLAAGEEVIVPSDLTVSPTYVPDLVNATLDLILDGECGIWHVSNCGSVSWAEFALSSARLAGLDHAGILPRPAASLSFRARRPRYSALGSTKGMILPSIEDALQRYFRDTLL